MSRHRTLSLCLRVLLPCFAAGALYGQGCVTQVCVSLSTTATTLQGGQTATLTALVTLPAGFPNPSLAVTWTFSPTVTGATLGTPSAPGANGITTDTYKAPPLISSRQVVTATATSVADPSQSASVQITLVPIVVVITVTPATVSLEASETQQFRASVTGISQTGVAWSISPQVGAIDSNGLYTAPATVTSSQKVTVTATSTFDPSVSGNATVTLTAPPAITVTVSPSTVSLTNNQTQQFTAVVANTANTAVTWSISPQTGTISATGLYTAPPLISATTKITVTATSAADPTKSGTATVTINNFVDIGSGAPPGYGAYFYDAYVRNGFFQLVALPPLGAVKKLGTTGYVQEFGDVSKGSSVKLALATASTTAQSPTGYTYPVVQLLSGVYSYYTSVGVTTAGYPLADTQTCPSFDPANACTFDYFDKGYALFSYVNPLAAGSNFTVRQGFYTEWTNLGGIMGAGRAVDVETAITASTGTTATQQLFSAGGIYSITNGSNKGKVFGVIEPLYDLYVSQGGPTGSLGLPIADLAALDNGEYIQKFEGGILQYSSGGGPTVRQPVSSVKVTGAPAGGSVTLNVSQTLTLTAIPMDLSGTVLTDRVISWSTTNAKVASIQANGGSAVVTAAGPGSATILAVSEGKQSPKINLVVVQQCCQVGDGAPATVAQAFLTALARNKLAIQTPLPAPAARVGNGWVQMIPLNDGTGAQYMVAQSDASGSAYIVAGALLSAYQALGGPAGALGYPASDASAGGTQLFEMNAALAGLPPHLVSGIVLSKWAKIAYETGAAGSPVSDASPFTTFGANSGAQQSFQGGAILGATAGPRAGQAFLTAGLILDRYTALGGPAGDFGMPISDEFVNGSLHQQNFEGGNITFSTGDGEAVEHAGARTPGVVVAPASVTAGGRVRVSVLGFSNGSTLKVSLAGQPDFVVTTLNGSYSWDMLVPLATKSGPLAIHAADSKGTTAADGSLTVRGLIDNRIPVSKAQGDNQTGLPGALLPVPLRVLLRDSSGNPVVGAPVTFQASMDVTITTTRAVTNGAGFAETLARLPSAEGIAAVTADAGSIAQAPVTFYMRAAAGSLSNFPKLSQAGTATLGNGSATIAQKGALLTSVASILRYHQNRADLPAPNGVADPLTLNQFLTAYCTSNQLCDGFLSNPASGEQIVNLWRAADFTGGVDVTAYPPALPTIADLLGQGSPVLLSLALSLNGAPAGGHFVVATGVAGDGSVLIQDPNLFFGRANLTEYLGGFTLGTGTWTAELRGVVQFALRNPPVRRFMVGALSQPADLISSLALSVQSPAGSCGAPVDFLDAVDGSGNPAPGALVSRIQVCDGSQGNYEVSVGAGQAYKTFVTDLLANGASFDISGNSPQTYRASRPQLALSLAPESTSFSADSVVNPATFTAGIAPAGLMAILGTGLSGAGMATTVDMDGTAARVVSATAFQIVAELPASIAPGAHVLTVSSAFGAAQQSVLVSPVAPAIYIDSVTGAGLLVNPDGTLNGPFTPLNRGKTLLIYATGLGTVTSQGRLSPVSTPVTVVLNGQELATAFAGLAPGYVGVYQVNLAVPANTPPSLTGVLSIKQGDPVSNIVPVAIQ